MIKIVDRSNHIPVDEWDSETYPITEQDRIFRNIRGEIILPISEFFCQGDEEKKSLDYFAMSTKRTYNSDETRQHICRYLNYFEKYYDTDKELLMILYRIKINIDYFQNYTKDNFMDDINRYIKKLNNFKYNNELINKFWKRKKDNCEKAGFYTKLWCNEYIMYR